MLRAILGSAFLMLNLALLSSGAADDKKKPEPKPDKKENVDKKEDKKEHGEKKDKPYVTAGKLLGTIVAVEESKRALRINIGQKTINPVAHEALQQAIKTYRKARSQQDKIAAAQQVASAQKDLYTSDLEVQTTDDVIIRVNQPPPQFDDKGRLRKYTKKELKDLKGDTKLPGYQGDFSNLRQRQIVQVTLVKKKEAVRARNAKGRDADTEMLNDNLLPLTNMIIVVQDPGG